MSESFTEMLNGPVPLKQKIWYYLTWLRPVTKGELRNLQAQLVIILEGMRSGDLHHYQIEKMLEMEIFKLKENKVAEKKEGKENKDNMFG